VSPTKADKIQRKAVVERVKQVILKTYPAAQVHVFGSCATGLNLPKSDIDLLCYYPAVKEISLINRLSSDIVKADICSTIEPIKNAKCPIIKYTDKSTSVNVVISFNRENGIHCVALVK
jgi:non-canonical poly(A) RNA polymerase PAPD5/7